MKKYRILTPIILVLLMLVSIYSMITSAINKENEINALISKAEQSATQGMYDKAAGYYCDVIAIDSDVLYYLKVADMYYNAGLLDYSKKWCEEAMSAYPNNAAVYERIIRVCIDEKKYSNAYEALDDFDGRKLSSTIVEQYRDELAFLYYVDYVNFDNVTSLSGNYVGFENKGLWGLATSKGSSKVKAKFSAIGYYANDMVAVCDSVGLWYFMNSEGEYMYNISQGVSGTITEVGLYNNELFPVCVDGEYFYFNLDMKKCGGPYEYAGSFSGGVAAIKENGNWYLIKNDETKINADGYSDIIVDERGVCCQKDRVFVNIDENYYLVNTHGEKIGTSSFESAELFSSDGYAAILQDGLWGFIDISGNIVIEPRFENAKSFSMGLAPIYQNNSWGYIDIDGNIVIPTEYVEAFSFSNSGTAYVKTEKEWMLLKLYRYNH